MKPFFGQEKKDRVVRAAGGEGGSVDSRRSRL